MDSQTATLGMGVIVGITVLWVAVFARVAWERDQWECLCGHKSSQHVSALDWDSNYGDPEHVGADYKKPGICRECLCRHFIRRAA